MSTYAGFSSSLEEELEELRGSAAFSNYVDAREHVLAMKDRQAATSGETVPSAYWREELSGFAYMFDASPLMIAKLRHQTYHVTGLKVYEYRTNRDKYQGQIANKLHWLKEFAGGDKMLVSEARELGGFGFEIENTLVNIDTLKFFEVLIALDRAAVLPLLSDGSRRPVVWEIGAGWGGFAYQLKTLFPNLTYVITDLPELFLFSATYLRTLFPDAKVVWGDVDDLEGTLRDTPDADFVFLPNDRLAETRLERVDLAINMVSFQEMTRDQVATYVHHAHELGAPFLYSLNRERSPYNDELDSVSGVIAERYWPHPIPMLPVSYTQLGVTEKMVRAAKRGVADDPNEGLGYRHYMGWRKLA